METGEKTGDLGECWIEDHTDGGGTEGPQTVDDWLDERVEALASMGEPVVTRVELPSGPSGYLDWPGELDTQTRGHRITLNEGSTESDGNQQVTVSWDNTRHLTNPQTITGAGYEDRDLVLTHVNVEIS